MTREQLDAATFNDTITNGGTQTLSVDTSRADDLVVLIDDGTTASAAGSYDIRTDVRTTAGNDFQQFNERTGSTAFAHEDPAYGEEMQITVTNQSGAGANYRITLLSYRQID